MFHCPRVTVVVRVVQQVCGPSAAQGEGGPLRLIGAPLYPLVSS